MLPRHLGFKVALVLLIVSVALAAATAVAATSGDRAHPGVSLDARAADGARHGGRGLNTQAIHPDRGGSETGDQVDGTTGTTQTPARTTTSLDEPTKSSDAARSTTGNRKATGPDATALARFGLCQAFADTGNAAGASNREDSIAYRNLAEAAAASGQSVADFCADVGHPGGDAARRDANDGSGSGRSPRS